MATNKKPNWTAAATSLVLLGLGATAQPLVSTWLHASAMDVADTYENRFFSRSLVRNEAFSKVVVDLRDTATDADVRDLDAKYGIDLQPNSLEARANRLYTFDVTSDLNVMARLQKDPRVEAVEPEEIFSIPEGSKADPTFNNPASALREMQLMQHHGPLTRYNGDLDDLMRYTMMPPTHQATYVSPSSDSDRRYLPKGVALLDEGLVGNAQYTVYSTAACPRVPAPASAGSRLYSTPQGNVVQRTQLTSLPDEPNPSAAFRIAPSSNKPNDPMYDKQWNFPMIGVEDAWTKTRGKGVVVAVIDTGCAIGKSKKGAACKDFADTKITDGYNFVDKNADPYDDHGHGTHVAGTIAESTNNAIGLAGIAPEATIMPLKVLTKEGWGTSADIADAIRYAADHKADVINMSLGSAQSSSVIHNAVKYARKKGVTIVCAAGNGFGEPVGYPAAYPECIAVSSVGPTGNIAFYSSYGKEVALAAPGGDMSNGAQDGIWQNTNYPEAQGGNGDDYYAFQGTSMASPHVAAVAALIESQGVHDPARVREILTQTATPNGEPKKYGAGILSASGAVARADAQNHWKLRHMLLLGLGVLIMTVGGPLRSIKLRAAMAVALGLGFFAPDWWTSMVGADSAWNLLGFSALLPMAGYALLRGGRGVKIAGTFALGVAVCLWANWNNGTLPFTTATFGATAALPWTFANLGATLAIGAASAYRAFRATNR